MTIAHLESVLTAGTATAHLTPERWAAANRHVIRKALAEFSHERILTPELLPAEGPTPHGPSAEPARYRVTSDDGSVEYRFSARKLELDHWSIADMSIRRLEVCAYPDMPNSGAEEGACPAGRGAELDALRFITEFREILGIRAEMLPVYLEEISSTLSSHAYKQWRGQPSAAELAAGVTGGADPALDFQTIERSMTEGHPCFVANNGRLGFGIADYRSFAPEAGAPVQLEWIAVHRTRAVFTSAAGLVTGTTSTRNWGRPPSRTLMPSSPPWAWPRRTIS